MRRSGFAIEPFGWIHGFFHVSSVLVMGVAPLELGMGLPWISKRVYPCPWHRRVCRQVRCGRRYLGLPLEQIGPAFLVQTYLLPVSRLCPASVHACAWNWYVFDPAGMAASLRDVRLAFFVVALCIPWCRCLWELENIKSRLRAENIKCSGLDADALCNAAFFTAKDIRLVRQFHLSVFFSARILSSGEM